MRRDLGASLIVIGVLSIIFAAVFFVILPNMPQAKTNLRLGDGIFNAIIASNKTNRDKGLSGITEFASDQALLMAFPSEGKWSIGVQDMKISIDIVWLSSNKKVVYSVSNVLPDDSRIFTPSAGAQYVVELPAGTINSKAIAIGKTAIFQINMGDIK